MPPENRIHRFLLIATILFLVSLIYSTVAFSDESSQIDWEKARELLQKERQGQSLTDEESAYLERAKQERAKRRQGRSRCTRRGGLSKPGSTGQHGVQVRIHAIGRRPPEQW